MRGISSLIRQGTGKLSWKLLSCKDATSCVCIVSLQALHCWRSYLTLPQQAGDLAAFDDAVVCNVARDSGFIVNCSVNIKVLVDNIQIVRFTLKMAVKESVVRLLDDIWTRRSGQKF